MRDPFEIQKNVNKTVKDGVKDIVLWIEQVEKDHPEIIEKKTAYQQMLQTTEKDRQERHKLLNRTQAQIMTKIVIQNERANLKRTRNLKDDDNLDEWRSNKPLVEKEKKKNQKENKTSETPATMDFVEVGTRRKKTTKKQKENRMGRMREPQEIQLLVPERKDRWFIPSL